LEFQQGAFEQSLKSNRSGKMLTFVNEQLDLIFAPSGGWFKAIQEAKHGNDEQ
jgi:hypothetical protein